MPGYAPDGWTSLVRHLRAHGVSDDEMTIAGVAIRTRRTNSLIDQFRDRVVFPITDPTGGILGFVGRRHPAASDDVPKYLNTSETALFHKGDQFYGTWHPGTIPVIVEGPMDAIAVALSNPGRYSGLAPLGTALTEQQAELLYGQGQVIIATDADTPGHKAAARDYWQLTAWGTNPTRAPIPPDSDPASIVSQPRTRNPRQHPRSCHPDGDADHSRSGLHRVDRSRHQRSGRRACRQPELYLAGRHCSHFTSTRCSTGGSANGPRRPSPHLERRPAQGRRKGYRPRG